MKLLMRPVHRTIFSRAVIRLQILILFVQVENKLEYVSVWTPVYTEIQQIKDDVWTIALACLPSIIKSYNFTHK